MGVFKEIRENSGMSVAEFAKYFDIPYRTVKGWEDKTRKCPDYLLELMEYKLKNERIGKYAKEY